MKIAIIGAGIAGLACAHELEKFGISPVIYEISSSIGEAFPHVGAALEIAYRPIKDAIKYVNETFQINIKPLNTVNSVVHHSPNKTTVIQGNLGYFIERSKGPRDIKVQMYNQLNKTKILFKEYGDYQQLCKDYDYVVIANGYINFTEELGCWKEWVNTYVKGAVVRGSFDPTQMVVWINKSYCKNGYAYLSPFSCTKASLNLVVTDVNEKEMNEFWKLFINTENIKFPVEEEFLINHVSGYVYPHKVGNILLAGNAGGALDPFLGFGIISSIISGVMAAHSIVENQDYEKLLDVAVKQNLRFWEFRKLFNSMNSLHYDLMISSIGLPVLKHSIYYSHLNVVKLGSDIFRLIGKMK